MIEYKKAVPQLSWMEVCARRIARHGISSPYLDAVPADIVRAMCGAHAQIISAAELSIGLRGTGITRTDIRKAIWNDRSLVKTYGPRGTLHLLPSQDLPVWTGALSATPYGRTADPRNELLTPEQAEAVIEGIAFVLEDAEMTADELTQALIDHVGTWAGDPVMPAFQGMWPRWRMAQSTAGVRGALCFGPNRGGNVTYTSPRRWIPGFKPAEERTALTEVVKQFLYSYGPATPQQFAQWLAVPVRWAMDLFDTLSSELQQVELEGTFAWVAAGDTEAPSTAPQGVRLLPYFDAYAVGSHPRELLFPGPASKRALANGQSGNYPVLLMGGIVAGVWHQSRSGKKLNMIVEPLQELTPAEVRELENQIMRVGEILEAIPEWKIGTVTTGPHA